MHLTPEEIVKLSLPERLMMIGQLWDSLESADVPVILAQQEELARRMAHLEDDRAGAVTWDKLKQELEQRLP